MIVKCQRDGYVMMMQANTLTLGLVDYQVIYTEKVIHFNQEKVDMICDHRQQQILIHTPKKQNKDKSKILLAQAIDRIIQRQSRLAQSDVQDSQESKCLLDSPETVMAA